VTPPDGPKIFWGNPVFSPSGGQLDVDGYRACNGVGPAIENIFWPENQAPPGTYLVEVREYQNCDPTPANWTLTVRVGDVIVHQTSGQGPNVGGDGILYAISVVVSGDGSTVVTVLDPVLIPLDVSAPVAVK
jgi:hypothetical protein